MIALADYNNLSDASYQSEGPEVFVAREKELAYLNSLLCQSSAKEGRAPSAKLGQRLAPAWRVLGLSKAVGCRW